MKPFTKFNFNIIPQFDPLLKDEPIPVNGKLKVNDKTGFGIELNCDKSLFEIEKGQRI